MAQILKLLMASLVANLLCQNCTFKKQKDLGIWQGADSLERFALCQSEGAGKDFCLSMREDGELFWAKLGDARQWIKYDNQLNINEWNMAKVTLVNPSVPVSRLSFFKQMISAKTPDSTTDETFYLGRLPEISGDLKPMKSPGRYDCVAKTIARMHLQKDALRSGLKECAVLHFVKDDSERLASRSLRNTLSKKIRVMAIDGRETANYVGLRVPKCLTVEANRLFFSPCIPGEEEDARQIFSMSQEYDRIKVQQVGKALSLLNDPSKTGGKDSLWNFTMQSPSLILKDGDTLRLTADFPLDRVSPDRQFTFIAFQDHSTGLREKNYHCLGFSNNEGLAVHFRNFTPGELLTCARLSFEPVIGF